MARVTVRLPAATLIVLGLLLAIAAPVIGAPSGGRAGGATVHAQLVDGDICGSVTAYTAPGLAGGADGSITINGVTDPIAAGTVVDAALSAALSAATTAAPVTACVTLTVNDDGTATAVVVGLAADATARLCGTVAATGDGAARVFTIGGVAVPSTVTAALDANLAALLNAAATANATVCLDVTADATTGAITAVANLDATFTACGQVVGTVSGSGTTYTVGGVSIPAAQLSAAEAAALQLAIANNVNACVDLVVADTVVTSATVRVDACVTVSARSTTGITLDSVAIPLAAGATVAPEARVNATLGVRVSIDATTGAVTVARIALAGCTESGTAAAGAAQLPDTSVRSQAPLLVAAVLLSAVAGAGFVVARRRDVPA